VKLPAVLLCLLAGVCGAADNAYDAARAAQEASIKKQQASVRKQEAAAVSQNPSFFMTSVSVRDLDPEQELACDRPPAAKIQELVDEGAKQTGLDTDLVRAVVRKESAYNPCAISTKGAQGLMQLMPAVQTQFGVTDAFDAKQNISAGTRLLKQLLNTYGGDLSKALGAYNAGSVSVDQFGGVPPFPETMQYVSGILTDLDKK
jgi:soluble lytic murein transglycosylase-like protein